VRLHLWSVRPTEARGKHRTSPRSGVWACRPGAPASQRGVGTDGVRRQTAALPPLAGRAALLPPARPRNSTWALGFGGCRRKGFGSGRPRGEFDVRRWDSYVEVTSNSRCPRPRRTQCRVRHGDAAGPKDGPRRLSWVRIGGPRYAALGFVADPVGSGFVSRPARPGANITGWTHLVGVQLVAKRLEIRPELPRPPGCVFGDDPGAHASSHCTSRRDVPDSSGTHHRPRRRAPNPGSVN
jgi:hypothetical protein